MFLGFLNIITTKRVCDNYSLSR